MWWFRGAAKTLMGDIVGFSVIDAKEGTMLILKDLAQKFTAGVNNVL